MRSICFVRNPFDRQRYGEPFEFGPNLIGISDVPRIRCEHDCALVRPVLNGTLHLKLPQRFADRGAADQKFLGERFLTQAASRRILSRDNLCGNTVGKTADERSADGAMDPDKVVTDSKLYRLDLGYSSSDPPNVLLYPSLGPLDRNIKSKTVLIVSKCCYRILQRSRHHKGSDVRCRGLLKRRVPCSSSLCSSVR